MNFVNYLGEPVITTEPKQKKIAAKASSTSFRKGWRVVGIPPGQLEAARSEHATFAASEAESGREAKPWDEQHWLMNAKRKPVRSKPYEIKSSADECVALAYKAGWRCVEVVAVAKEAA